MSDIVVLLLMVGCAMGPFLLLTLLMRRGAAGLAMTAICLLGGLLVVLIFASGRPMGLHPGQAMGWALLVFLPATLGSGAGILMGWLLRRRDDQRIS